MTAIHWLNAINGSFTNASDWSGGVVPGASDDAILDASGSNYTVTSSVDETVDSIQLTSNAVLAVTSGTFTATGGTGSGANAGKIVVGGGALDTAGTLRNTGSVDVEDASLFVATSNIALTGGGVVNLVGGELDVGAIKTTVENVNDTISGEGFLLRNSPTASTFENMKHGVINAVSVGQTQGEIMMGGSQVTHDRTIHVVNYGLIETTTGNIYIEDALILGRGSISVATGTSIEFDGVRHVLGQMISIAAEGTMTLVSTSITYGGTLNNAGTLAITPGSEFSALTLKRNTTLTGGGSVDLDFGFVGGSDATLINVDNTIIGNGELGNGQIGLVNEPAGVVDATINGPPLTIDCGGATIDNAGLIEGAGGQLTIASAVLNTGTITSKSSVTLNGGLINDGVVMTRGVLALNGLVTGTGSIKMSDTAYVELAQSQSFSNTIVNFRSQMNLDLRDIGFVNGDEATYSGTSKNGVLTVTDGTHTANIRLNGDYLGLTFLASSDGNNGTNVVVSRPQAPSAAHFASAMAAITGHGVAAGLIDARAVTEGRQMMLAAPRLAIA